MLFSFCLFSCDSNRVVDEYISLGEEGWKYDQKVSVGFQIQDTTQFYNIYFNSRNTGSYPYQNIYVLMRITDPNGEVNENRLNFSLADKDGKWFGAGLGDLYDNQIKIVEGLKFLIAGEYQIELEQNMRDNPLQGLVEVGVRVEVVKE
jgi:gliding motility-associated lipoprotein GldH